jgi:hypothetical protein
MLLMFGILKGNIFVQKGQRPLTPRSHLASNNGSFPNSHRSRSPSKTPGDHKNSENSNSKDPKKFSFDTTANLKSSPDCSGENSVDRNSNKDLSEWVKLSGTFLPINHPSGKDKHGSGKELGRFESDF